MELKSLSLFNLMAFISKKVHAHLITLAWKKCAESMTLKQPSMTKPSNHPKHRGLSCMVACCWGSLQLSRVSCKKRPRNAGVRDTESRHEQIEDELLRSEKACLKHCLWELNGLPVEKPQALEWGIPNLFSQTDQHLCESHGHKMTWDDWGNPKL